MSEMAPDKLKLIAEGMGYEFPSKGLPDIIVVKGKDGHGFWNYNPLTNAEQCMEIMAKMLMDIDSMANHVGARVHGDRVWCTGKTINEAVCNAAYEYFNNENN